MATAKKALKKKVGRPAKKKVGRPRKTAVAKKAGDDIHFPNRGFKAITRKEKIIRYWDPSEVHTGADFSAHMIPNQDKPATTVLLHGKIYVEEDGGIFLCYKKPFMDPDDEIDTEEEYLDGYPYSYGINREEFERGEDAHRLSSLLNVSVDPSAPKTFIVNSKTVVFMPGYIKVGCVDIPNTMVREITKRLID